MARQPASNEEALVKLGSEKLARLVIGEAKRNAAFRKLVAAALAATKGPAAVAAIIDKRLAGLDRAKPSSTGKKPKLSPPTLPPLWRPSPANWRQRILTPQSTGSCGSSRPPIECSSGSTIRMAACRTSIMRPPLLSNFARRIIDRVEAVTVRGHGRAGQRLRSLR
jgi:hypothetical protein